MFNLKDNMARRSGRSAFTLIELMVVISIIAVLATITTLVFQSATDGALLAQAHNTLVSYAKLARSYAIANQIETLMVVNPHNGRIELWHANAPASGGTWDPTSRFDPTAAINAATNNEAWTDGYTFANVFDSGAQLAVDSSGRPRVAVHPIDFYDFVNNQATRGQSGTATNEQNIDNLTWAAVCFDPSGSLVTRTRRVATRTYLLRDGTLRSNSGGIPTRLPDGQIDTATPANPAPNDIVNLWLRHTLSPRAGVDTAADVAANVSEFADIIVFNRFSGQEAARVE
jgi:prepilin-type N-terminal cleavage/methylation domain-containing protein